LWRLQRPWLIRTWIDSNLLLRISRRGDPDHRIVDGALERLLKEDAALYYTHQNIAEFWNVWTRPADKNSFALTGKTASEIGRFEGMMKFCRRQLRRLREMAATCP
jgi:hypothetical protein